MARAKQDYFIVAGAVVEAARIFRRGWIARYSGRIASMALQRGMRSGNRGWLYVAAGAQGLRLLQRLTASKPDVYSLKLHPGEGIEIREIPRVK